MIINTEVKIKRVSLPVEGMTCAACSARVEKVLNKVEGISNVSVNLAMNTASFDFYPESEDSNPAALSETISSKVKSYGYNIDTSFLLSKDKTKSHEKDNLPSDQKNNETLFNFRVSLLFTIPIFILNMGVMWTGFQSFIHLTPENINKVLLILTTPVMFIPGRYFFSQFYKNLRHFSADMNSLVAIGTGTAYLFSTFATLFPDSLHSLGIHNSHSAVYFDTAAVIITLILMGRMLESRAKLLTINEIKKLFELKAKKATIRRGESIFDIDINELVIKDVCIVKPGAKIPADGIIINGSTETDESMLTGESFPVAKSEGDKVSGGTINISGNIEFEVVALGDNSILGKIIKYVEQAQGSKAPIQNLADKTSAIFVPTVIAIALMTFIFNIFWGGADSFGVALLNMIAVLIIACPCSLGLATPTAIIVATGIAAKFGILIKNGRSLEIANKIDIVIFDKTGTLTTGKLAVSKIKIFKEKTTESYLLKYLSSVENKSEHPVSLAIVKYANHAGVNLEKCTNFENFPGRGIKGIIDNKEVIAGKLSFISDCLGNKFINPIMNIDDNESSTIIFVSIDNELTGAVLLSDILRSTSILAIKRLKKLGIFPVMLTGDNLASAQKTANQLGDIEFRAEVFPEDKAKIIKEYQLSGKKVAMIGDGINDAPALAVADLGIAMGSGTDVAIETADATLLSSDPMHIVTLIEISRRSVKIIKQNLFWAFVYNSIGIPFAAFGLLNPMIAAGAMSLSSVSVVSNSLRIKNYKIKDRV